MVFILRSLAALALVVAASAFPSPFPVEEVSAAVSVVERDLSLSKRADFQYRFYDNFGCDHGSNAGDTYPTNNVGPGQGTNGQCFSAPTGINWNRVEIDQSVRLQTFCNINCGGTASVVQTGTHCFLPTSGCAIGSFRVV